MEGCSYYSLLYLSSVSCRKQPKIDRIQAFVPTNITAVHMVQMYWIRSRQKFKSLDIIYMLISVTQWSLRQLLVRKLLRRALGLMEIRCCKANCFFSNRHIYFQNSLCKVLYNYYKHNCSGLACRVRFSRGNLWKTRDSRDQLVPQPLSHILISSFEVRLHAASYVQVKHFSRSFSLVLKTLLVIVIFLIKNILIPKIIIFAIFAINRLMKLPEFTVTSGCYTFN